VSQVDTPLYLFHSLRIHALLKTGANIKIHNGSNAKTIGQPAVLR
jgi:hypothetical protein